MLRFADCVLDVPRRELLRHGRAEHLEPQAFDVLVHLVSHRDRVVLKGELLDVVWGGRFITESALTTRIKEIRQSVGDDGVAQSVVRTVRGRGYRFVAPITDMASPRTPDHRVVGRDRDLAELVERLQPGALVTLVGPGGVGKTTLGRALVEVAGKAFADGAIVVDLSVLESPASLVGAVARAAQVVLSGVDELVDSISRLDALLLLDDADDLVPEVARLCGLLRSVDSRLAIVVTCRERLAVPGEQLWPVLPLSADAARELLLSRARDIAPFARLAQHDAEALDGLTDAVDRLPLAVEMLAAMTAVLDVDDLRELVESRPDLVTAVHRDAPARHRSLALLVTASIDRLDVESRRSLVGLTGFAGPFSATDAAGVLGGHGLENVRGLVDRSLLSPVDGGAPRFQLLRTVRRAVEDQADPASLLAASRRHAEHVTGVLERADADLRREHEARAAATFERLEDEARAAHAWARRHDPELAVRLTRALHLYAYSRLWAEPTGWAWSLHESMPRTDGRVIAVLATQAGQDGRLLDGRAWAESLLDDDVPLRASALETLSDVALYLGDHAAAETHGHELAQLGTAVGDPRMVAIGLTNESLAMTYDHRPTEALRLLDRDEPSIPPSVAPSDQAWLGFARGEALARLGDGRATGQLDHAITLGEAVGNRFVAGVARSSLAGVLLRSGDLAAAAQTYVEILETFVRHGNITHLVEFLGSSVPLLGALGEPEAASVVGAWTLSQRARQLHDVSMVGIRTTLGALADAHDAATLVAWQEEATGLGSTAAAMLALTALRRHAGS